MSYFCDVENRESKQLAPGVNARTFWGEKMLLAVVVLDPHAVVPMHSHPHEQCGTVIEGTMRLTIAGEARWLKPGDTYVIPGGVEHMAEAGEEAARILDVFAPVREEYKY
ncbi:MAG: cupin domain-containing protein [Anaerolineales bacterium]|nr:cupin domain-containing protein [Anaerolineales bacterium]